MRLIMFGGKLVVATIFKIINVGVLIGLIIYLLKTKFIAVFKENFDQKKIALQLLCDNAHALKKANIAREEELVVLEQEGIRLKYRLERWQQAEKERFIHEQRYYDERLKRIHQKIEQQRAYLMQQHIARLVVPEALAKAEERLKITLAQQKGTRFINDLIEVLQ
jgi:hypothetical protein